MKPNALADRLDRIANRLPSELAAAQKRVGIAAVKIARSWSSGTETQAALDSADNPYATRHEQKSMYPEINRQGGTFFAGWVYDPSRTALVNAVPYGIFLQEGTAVMNPRDILGAISRELRPIMRQEVSAAVKRSLKG